MNLFLNLNENDKWLENNFPSNLNKTNIIIQKKESESINDSFWNWLDTQKEKKNGITSINLIFSLKNYKEYEFFNLNNFLSFNKKWNIKLVEEIKPLITFSKANKIFFNFIFIQLDKGLHNVANIALKEILKNLTFGLNTESSFLKIFSKFIVIDKSNKKKLKKIEKLILSKNKMFLFNI
ncbi:MAG: hypothetical protein K2N92_01685 [Malacoplasma sp.]|nr:hypothetical protein [Malacoplasma sp.]MDE7112292.1 hypothetical protein [Malacoplasma sp.]